MARISPWLTSYTVALQRGLYASGRAVRAEPELADALALVAMRCIHDVDSQLFAAWSHAPTEALLAGPPDSGAAAAIWGVTVFCIEMSHSALGTGRGSRNARLENLLARASVAEAASATSRLRAQMARIFALDVSFSTWDPACFEPTLVSILDEVRTFHPGLRGEALQLAARRLQRGEGGLMVRPEIGRHLAAELQAAYASEARGALSSGEWKDILEYVRRFDAR
jgi:hypothetical protein